MEKCDCKGPVMCEGCRDAAEPKMIAGWPDPEPWMLEHSLFNTIWGVIKAWDINVPSAYEGYCGATGNHARAIFDAILEGELLNHYNAIEVDIFRQWFDAVQDIHPKYLSLHDYTLAQKVYEHLGMRVPNSIESLVAGVTAESSPGKSACGCDPAAGVVCQTCAVMAEKNVEYMGEYLNDFINKRFPSGLEGDIRRIISECVLDAFHDGARWSEQTRIEEQVIRVIDPAAPGHDRSIILASR